MEGHFLTDRLHVVIESGRSGVAGGHAADQGIEGGVRAGGGCVGAAGAQGEGNGGEGGGAIHACTLKSGLVVP